MRQTVIVEQINKEFCNNSDKIYSEILSLFFVKYVQGEYPLLVCIHD